MNPSRNPTQALYAIYMLMRQGQVPAVARCICKCERTGFEKHQNSVARAAECRACHPCARQHVWSRICSWQTKMWRCPSPFLPVSKLLEVSAAPGAPPPPECSWRLRKGFIKASRAASACQLGFCGLPTLQGSWSCVSVQPSRSAGSIRLLCVGGAGSPGLCAPQLALCSPVASRPS